ncbi:MAG: hypothetical protein ACRDVZ_16085 [Jiangellaceae bacterium]
MSVPYDGWGEIPDQRGHQWEHDDRSSGMPAAPEHPDPMRHPPGRAERAAESRSTRWNYAERCTAATRPA